MKKKIFRWTKIVVLLYCVIGIALYSLQDKLLFRPVPINRDHHYDFPTAYREVNLPYNAGTNINLVQFYPTPDSVPAKGVVLYFHGNRENISWYARNAPRFTSRGYEVWMIDYPGYGKSTGEFTEQRLYDWALLEYKLARKKYEPGQIILYGKSMGTGIAAQLASVRDCRRLLLEAPYYSFPSIIGAYMPIFPVDKMIRFKIPTWQYLQKVTAPITIFHGTSDGVIRYRCSERLKPFLKPADEFITIDGGSHNDLTSFPVYEQKLDSLLRSVGSWSAPR